MQDRPNQPISPIVQIAGIALIGYAVAKSFSDSMSLDLTAGINLLLGSILGLGLIGYAVWNELTDSGWFGLRTLLPFALATVWMGLWPAMQTWGAKPLYLPGMPLDNSSVAAWATTYTEWSVAAVLLIGGYAVSYWSWKRS